MGLINAAIWLGAAFFVSFGLEPAATSPGTQELLGQRNFPYFSIALSQVVSMRFVHVYLLCSVIALAHMAAEWLYLGKYPKRLWLGLVLGLGLIGLCQNYWLLPKLRSWHYQRYTPQARTQMADRSYRYGHAVYETLNCAAIAGLALYLWRVAHPPDPARFVSATKFRG